VRLITRGGCDCRTDIRDRAALGRLQMGGGLCLIEARGDRVRRRGLADFQYAAPVAGQDMP